MTMILTLQKVYKTPFWRPTHRHKLKKKKRENITILLTEQPWKFQVEMVLYNTFKVQNRYLSVLISNCIVLLSQFVHLKLQKCLETSLEEVQYLCRSYFSYYGKNWNSKKCHLEIQLFNGIFLYLTSLW